jgi:ubiquinone/menaquinone biosynthesis C-methylase UbiE
VLDLGCGWGRHSVELARRGCAVVGIDQSAELLEHARRGAEDAGVQVEWVHGDYRKLDREAEFDAVLSLFSSLGYSLRDADDLSVLSGARRALRSDGVFVLETMHRDQIARSYAARDWWRSSRGSPIWVEREFDAVDGVSREWLRWHQGGEIREKFHEIRIRCATEWMDLLMAAGLEPLACYGDWGLTPFGHRSGRLLVMAEPGSSPGASPGAGRDSS